MSYSDKYPIPVRVNYNVSTPIEFPFHSHYEYEIYYFQEGKGNYLIGDKIYVLEPGDLIIMHGMTLHCPNLDNNRRYVRSMIHFDPSYIQELYNYPYQLNILKPFQELRNYRLHLSREQQREIEELFKKLQQYRNLNNQFGFNRFVLTLMDFMVFVYGLFENSMTGQPEHPSEKVRHVQNIILYIEQNYMHNLHLSDLEEQLHLNRYYLSKIFKEVTGATIFNYLLQRRINEAKICFLIDGSMSVTEVSYLVGFKHPAHFSRVFKQQVGLTAKEYRKLHTDKNTNEC